jgi:xylulokinase
MSWTDFSRALSSTPAGNQARIFLPWYEPEITPSVQNPGVHRYGLEERDGPGHVRGVIESQMMAIARHSRWMGVDVDTIYATGGAAANVQILQVMADVFNAQVYQLEVGNSAALGAALRARHADASRSGQPLSWEQVIDGLVEPVAASRLDPHPAAHTVYRELMKAHEACEAHALGRGPDPSPLLSRLATSFADAT